ncbi:glycine zipper family protein [Vibrio ostreicida]|nr:glycine zipper family protein [Vibrio ostreicida]
MKLFFTLLLSVGLVACAYNQQPIVDMQGVDEEQYQQDFNDCQGYADRVDKGEAAKTGAANSAVTGAVIGAVVGVIEDGVGGAVVGSAAGGAVGAGAGALGGVSESTQVQSLVLRQCLAKKGYTVYDLQ